MKPISQALLHKRSLIQALAIPWECPLYAHKDTIRTEYESALWWRGQSAVIPNLRDNHKA